MNPAKALTQAWGPQALTVRPPPSPRPTLLPRVSHVSRWRLLQCRVCSGPFCLPPAHPELELYEGRAHPVLFTTLSPGPGA